MKNSSNQKTINANNIFEINRLALSDTFEAGKSLTFGLDYKIDMQNNFPKKINFLNLKSLLY